MDPDLGSLAALTAECKTRQAYEAALLEWLSTSIGFDTSYFGAAEPSQPVAPSAEGVPRAFVERCEGHADRYWRDRLALHEAARVHGGAVYDRDVLGSRARARMPLYREIIASLGLAAVAVVALRARGEPIGCLYLGRRGTGARFVGAEIDVLRRVAPIVGLGAALHLSSNQNTEQPWLALTRREQEVAELVCKGMTNPEIARVLGTSPRTVKNQVASILRRVGVSNRTELAVALAGDRSS